MIFERTGVPRQHKLSVVRIILGQREKSAGNAGEDRIRVDQKLSIYDLDVCRVPTQLQIIGPSVQGGVGERLDGGADYQVWLGTLSYALLSEAIRRTNITIRGQQLAGFAVLLVCSKHPPT